MFKKIKMKIRGVIREEVKEAIKPLNKKEARISNNIKYVEENLLTKKEYFDTILYGKEEYKDFILELKLALYNDDVDLALKIINGFSNKKDIYKDKYLKLSNELRNIIIDKQDNEKYKDVLKTLFNSYSIDEFGQEQYHDVHVMKYPILAANSLKQNFVRRRRMKQIGNVPDRWLVYNKELGEEFAKMLNIKCPKVFAKNVRIDNLTIENDIMIKPMKSSDAIGAYIVFNENRIYSIYDKKYIGNYADMKEHIYSDIDKGLYNDSFLVQEVIYSNDETKEPAHDLKFFCFYGEIGGVMEVSRYPKLAYWFWTEEGKSLNLGINPPKDIEPLIFDKKMIEIVKKISLKIPSPYMRIDFLRGEKDMFFCEFCTMSGDIAGPGASTMEKFYDRKFGNMYLKAEMRIINDLLNGKKFDEINILNAKYDTCKGNLV